eukprot:TRINITY_DN105478_c0_g1_i1.p1 TRINITY_DN105478_c0_g1~~TRINITY_DN105478_c0_g1_i1.p1  ORF type:complete len:443 (+),score=64.43 TRINITY_DN105478_c0_g1_i1:69-1397(+)
MSLMLSVGAGAMLALLQPAVGFIQSHHVSLRGADMSGAVTSRAGSQLPSLAGLTATSAWDSRHTAGAHTWPQSCFSLVLAAAGAGLLARASTRRDGKRVARRAAIATRPDQAVPWWERLAPTRIEPGIGIWAEKVNMTKFFREEEGNARAIPATILCVKRGGNWVTNKKWPERDGFYAVEVGYERYTPQEWERKTSRMVQVNRLARFNIPPLRKFKEFRVRPHEWDKYEIGQKLVVSDIFKEGDFIDVHGRSKGKGFASRIKKWGQKRGPMTHGSKHHRRYGSVGAGTTPGRILPGKHMPGWMGDQKVGIRRLQILKIMDNIDEDNMPETIIVVKGAVPGYSAHWKDGGSYVYLHHSLNLSDGRFKRDPVWLWYYEKGEKGDIFKPLKQKAWTVKTVWGRDARWQAHEIRKYWPDGYPGYDHSGDPFHDDCDPRIALKASEW